MTNRDDILIFDVIIPTFNRASLLERAINSVLTQSYPHFELYVIDDGSNDETAIVIQKYLDDSRFHYFKQENSGVSKARNQGIRLSQNNWVTFLDSDDEWEECKLQEQKNFILTYSDFSFVHSNEFWIRDGVRVNPPLKFDKSSEGLLLRSLETCIISPSTVAIKRELLERFCGFNEELVVCEDYDLWLKILFREKVGFIEKSLIKKYHGHENQLSTQDPLMEYYRVLALFEQLGSKDLGAQELELISSVLKRKIPRIMKGLIKFEALQKYEKIQALGHKFGLLCLVN